MSYDDTHLYLGLAHPDILAAGDLRRRGPFHDAEDLGEPEGADHCGNEIDTARKRLDAEGEAEMRVQRLHAYHGDEQAQNTGDVALERIVERGELARDQDTEQCQPEELVGAEVQRGFAEQRCQDGEEDDADDGADCRRGRRKPHGEASLALQRQRVAVEGCCGTCRGAGDGQQDRGAAAAVDGTDINAHEDEDRLVGGHLVGQRHQERDAHRRGQAGQGADDDPE